MRAKLASILIAFFIFAMISAKGTETQRLSKLPEGKLLYIVSNRLYELQFPSLNNALVLADRRALYFESVADADHHQVIFSVVGGGTSLTSYLQLFDTVNGGLKQLHVGRNPVYLPASNALFFISSYSDGAHSPEPALYEAELRGSAIRNVRLVKRPPVYDQTAPVAVSQHEVVFSNGKDGEQQATWLYDVRTKQLKKIPELRHCIPQLWRSKTHQLMCFRWNGPQFYLTDLRGKGEESLPFNPASTAFVAYIPEHDIFIITKTGTRLNQFPSLTEEIHDLWAIHLNPDGTFAQRLLTKNITTGLNGAVWISKIQ